MPSYCTGNLPSTEGCIASLLLHWFLNLGYIRITWRIWQKYKDPDAVVFQGPWPLPCSSFSDDSGTHLHLRSSVPWQWPSHVRAHQNYLGELLMLSMVVPRWLWFSITLWVSFHLVRACGHGKSGHWSLHLGPRYSGSLVLPMLCSLLWVNVEGPNILGVKPWE